MNTLVRVGLSLSPAVVFPLMAGFGIEAFFATPLLAVFLGLILVTRRYLAISRGQVAA